MNWPEGHAVVHAVQTRSVCFNTNISSLCEWRECACVCVCVCVCVFLHARERLSGCVSVGVSERESRKERDIERDRETTYPQ